MNDKNCERKVLVFIVKVIQSTEHEKLNEIRYYVRNGRKYM